jgi:hypothetical protein
MSAALQHHSNTKISIVFHSMAEEEIFRTIEGNKEGAYEDNKGMSKNL